MSSRQTISGGDDSLNVQAGGGVTLYQGMQYADIRQLFMDLFQQNYEVLLADAGHEAERRAAAVVDAFVQKLEAQPRELLDNLREPGVQRALVQAQVEHATSGDPDDVDVYANLLVEKVQYPVKDLTSIALQQAIETVRQLTQQHMDILTVLFVVLKIRFAIRSLQDLQETLVACLAPFTVNFTGRQDVLRHLDASGCLAFDTTRAYDIRQILRGNYPAAFDDATEPDAFVLAAGDNDAVLGVLRQFMEHEGFLRSCFLSNTGVAIAHANLSRHVPVGPLSIWITG